MTVGKRVRINKGYEVTVLEVFDGGAKVRSDGGAVFTILDSEVV